MTKVGQSRGDTWENKVAHYFNDLALWHGKRLAPSSQENPDVIVTYKSKIFVFECKASTQNSVFVELNQLMDAVQFLEIFDHYVFRYVSVAWYFLGKTRNKQGQYISRDIKTYIVTWSNNLFMDLVKKYYFDDYLPNESKLAGIECTYDGSIRYRIKSTVKKGAKLTDKLEESNINELIKKDFPYIRDNSLSQFKDTFASIPYRLLGGGFIDSITGKVY